MPYNKIDFEKVRITLHPIDMQPGLIINTSGKNHGDINAPGSLVPDSLDMVISFTLPQSPVPGPDCPWKIEVRNRNEHYLIWDNVEKPHKYIEWLQYLIANFFAPWNHSLYGKVYWKGQSRKDFGTISIIRDGVRDNVLKIKKPVVKYVKEYIYIEKTPSIRKRKFPAPPYDESEIPTSESDFEQQTVLRNNKKNKNR